MSSYALGPDPARTAAPPRGLPDLARPLAIVAAIAAWTLLVNLPTFARQDADDHALRRGRTSSLQPRGAPTRFCALYPVRLCGQ